jgi:hypothetical protein
LSTPCRYLTLLSSVKYPDQRYLQVPSQYHREIRVVVSE